MKKSKIELDNQSTEVPEINYTKITDHNRTDYQSVPWYF